jgi:hypothetical protein
MYMLLQSSQLLSDPCDILFQAQCILNHYTENHLTK